MKFTILLPLLLILSSCSSTQTPQPLPEAKCYSKVIERLYFGADSPDGPVSEAQWQEFVRSEATPRFPSGLTVVHGQGQWQGEDKRIVQEVSRILEIVHEDTPQQAAAVQRIAQLYKQQFRQEAVMVLSSPVRACF